MSGKAYQILVEIHIRSGNLDLLENAILAAPQEIRSLDYYSDAHLLLNLSHDIKHDETFSVISDLLGSFVGSRASIVPIGDLCFAAQLVKELNCRASAHLFDWLYLGYEGPAIIKSLIDDNFQSPYHG